jgi:ABC-type oligopeptide transport system substrate-binding subunit
MRQTGIGSRSRWLLAAVVLMLSLVTAACGGAAESETYQYPADGYLGITQTNPELPTNPSSRSYAENSEVIQRTLLSIDGIERVSSFSNGPHVVVYLTLKEGLSDREREAIREKAEKALSFNSPGFDYQVRLR